MSCVTDPPRETDVGAGGQRTIVETVLAGRVTRNWNVFQFWAYPEYDRRGTGPFGSERSSDVTREVGASRV